MEDMEKKADEMLDEETESTTEEENKPAQKGMSPEEAIDALRKECRGTLRLMVPFKARGEDVKEMPFDFCALTGTEIKSVRAGRVNIKESYAKVQDNAVIIYGMHISPYEQGNIFNVDPLRPRKLLLHKKEIRKIADKLAQQGLTLVPLKIYINEDGRAKMEIAIGRGKKLYDKRADIAKRDADRRMQRAVRR